MLKIIQKLLLLACICTSLFYCTASEEPTQGYSFAHTIEQFPQVNLPLEIYYPTIGNLDTPALDSQFVVQFIDKDLYNSECSCMYGQGKIVKQENEYVALLLPLDWNAGITYELRTFTPTGQVISQIKFAQSGEESISGWIDSTGLIRQVSVESFMEEEEGLSPDQRQVKFFQIQKDGRIQATTSPADVTQAWLGEWNWQTPFDGSEGTLFIGPDKNNHIRIEFLHTYKYGQQTRDYSGVALIEEEGQSASSLELGCLQLRRTSQGIEVDGNCIESWDANFSGHYLSQEAFPYRYFAKNDSLSDDFCDVYQVWDARHAPVSLPANIQEQLNCAGQMGLSPDWQKLLYADSKGLIAFDFNTQEQQELIALQTNLDGLSDLAWASDGKNAAFVEIQQDAIESRTRLHIISFKDQQISTHYFDVSVHFFCGSTCLSIPYEDFWWDEKGNIRYLDDLKVKQLEDPSTTVEPEILELNL